MNCFILLALCFIPWKPQCTELQNAKNVYHPTHSTLYFKSYDFELNNPNHWNWSTSSDNTFTKACTKPFTNLCIYLDSSKAGFIMQYNHKQYNFLHDNDWSSIDTQYPLSTIIMTPSRRHLMEERRRRRPRHGAGFGSGGMGGLGDMNGLGMMPGFGGSVGGMMPGIGQLGGMLNPNMGGMPPMGGGYGMGLGGTAGNSYPGYQMGYANPMRNINNMYKMYSRVLEGKPVWKNPHRRRRRRRRRGRRGRRRRRHKNYMKDRGQFGRMGFPSLTGNMMGLVQSSKHLPNFMKVPPTIHITADFRRLLGIKTKGDKDENVWLNKCVFVDNVEVCTAYDLIHKAIVLKYVEIDEEHDDDVKDVEEVRDSEDMEGNNEWNAFKTIVWSEINDKCNDLLLSIVNYTICIEAQQFGDVVYFKETAAVDEETYDKDVVNWMKTEYQRTKLSILEEKNWNEIYKHSDKNRKRLCRFMPLIKLCAEININSMKILQISIQIVDNV